MTTLTPSPVPDRTYVNIHGRRGGRGIRPWLLIPKVIAVAMYLGGLATVTVIWSASGYATLAAEDPRRQWVLTLVGRLMVGFVVPALVIALILGGALLLQMPRQFLRMRWMQIKLITLLILVPAAHLYCSSRTAILRDPASTEAQIAGADQQLTIGLFTAFVGFAWVVLLGRLKPRLGQNPARSHIPAEALQRE